MVCGLACLAAVVSAAHLQPLTAQDQDDALREPREPHPAADEAIARLKSPYCPGLMLEVCTSYTGTLLRDSMQVMAREGWTTDELSRIARERDAIKQRFADVVLR